MSHQVNTSSPAARPQDARLFLRDEELERGIGLVLAGERRLSSAAQTARKTASLNHAEFQVLMALRSEPGLSVMALRDKLGATVPTMARILGKLAKSGLINRPRSQTDGRKRRLVLTEDGIELTDPAAEAMCEALRTAFKQAGAEQVAGAISVLEALKSV